MRKTVFMIMFIFWLLVILLLAPLPAGAEELVLGYVNHIPKESKEARVKRLAGFSLSSEFRIPHAASNPAPGPRQCLLGGP